MTDVRCKVCHGYTEIQGYVDAGRSCEIGRGVYLPLKGIPICYHRCTVCGFIFTPAFDHWSFDEFRAGIYNDDYAIADPDFFSGERARRFAPAVLELMGKDGRNHQSVLDYGCGTGAMVGLLSASGKRAVGYEPLANVAADVPRGSFDLVTAIEVLEHSPDPHRTVQDIVSFLAPGGEVLFSTQLCDKIPRQTTDWWYMAPRNGHISFYTRQSLVMLFKDHGVGQLAEGVYLATNYVSPVPSATSEI